MTDRTFDLYSEVDADRGTRDVWLRLTEDGALVLEGRDFGPGVGAVFGEDFSEYEWEWELPAERLEILLDSLGVAAGSLDFFEQLGSRLKTLDGPQMQTCFEEAGAELWSRIGE